MYTGIGCASCRRSPISLGIAPIVAAEIPTVLNAIKGLFQGSSYDATHQQILAWAQAILNDPASAFSGNYTTVKGPLTPANAWLLLNVWAANPQAYQTYLTLGGTPLSPGVPLGCEAGHGCLADAQSTVRTLAAKFQVTAPALASQNTMPSGSVTAPGGTIYSPLPGGGGLNIPVPTSSLLNATIGGIPVLLIAAGLAVFAFAGGHRTGRR